MRHGAASRIAQPLEENQNYETAFFAFVFARHILFDRATICTFLPVSFRDMRHINMQCNKGACARHHTIGP